MTEYLDSVRKGKKGYDRALEQVCRQWGLTRNEMDVLLFLYNNPGLNRAVDIVSRRGIAKSHVSLAVSGLEARGFLEGVTEDSDRRTIRLRILDGALPAAQQGRNAQFDYFNRLLDGVTEEEKAIFGMILTKIHGNIENMED